MDLKVHKTYTLMIKVKKREATLQTQGVVAAVAAAVAHALIVGSDVEREARTITIVRPIPIASKRLFQTVPIRPCTIAAVTIT